MPDYYPETATYQSERAIARIDAMAVPCAYCHAGIDQECYDPRSGIVIGKQPAHYKRLLETGWR